MRRVTIALILLSVFHLTSCNSLKVPKSMGDHKMSAAPVNAVPTSSEWILPEKPMANEETPIKILIKDESDQPIQLFETVHEKKMHMFIVSKDLSYFSHIHPKYKGDGEFDITTTFPAGGDYKLIAEVTPKGGVDSSIESHWQKVAGEEAAPKPLIPDQKLTKTIDGKKVTLSFDHLAANKTLHMTFSIYDAKSGKPIETLQPYLGALGHTVAISANAEKYLHIHPMTLEGSGPNVTFMTIFPDKGIYKIWGQFQHEGEIFTVPFVVEVGA
ncbi:hypothetical protein [Neobacillus mesonae]|uniref:YtkA-like domain-containing protein n=1 Tax=Neobacillus mesonae TaxID=1193713 RepID=A0A3Q9QPK8_9BACI|nr:hypothetical protein [Neobacillus mesonae]AZU60230.1 hypothetical protein CHR53_02520 [Neobacillus mesonae]